MELNDEQKTRVQHACFFARLKHSQTGEALGSVLASITETAFNAMVRYRGNDPKELWHLREKWKAREDFQHELMAQMDARIEDLERVAEEVGISSDELEIRSLIEDVRNNAEEP